MIFVLACYKIFVSSVWNVKYHVLLDMKGSTCLFYVFFLNRLLRKDAENTY